MIGLFEEEYLGLLGLFCVRSFEDTEVGNIRALVALAIGFIRYMLPRTMATVQ